jgi:transcriptional regulator with XRE-family HTH domain
MSGRKTLSQRGPGRLVKHYRLRKGWSQEELAERSGLSARSISDIERARQLRPSPGTVRRLADGLALTWVERREFIEQLLSHRTRAVEPSFIEGNSASHQGVYSPGLDHDWERETVTVLRLLRTELNRLLWSIEQRGEYASHIASDTVRVTQHDISQARWSHFASVPTPEQIGPTRPPSTRETAVHETPDAGQDSHRRHADG